MVHPRGFEAETTATWQSRSAGDIVFATVPPYMSMGWMSMGIPLLSALLEEAGITSRIVRFGDVPNDAPPDILLLQDATLWGDPPLSQRLDNMREAADRNPDFFEFMLSRLLAGPERIFGFSIWRLNVDVALEVARRIKLRRPEAYILFGGPETGEAPLDLCQAWVDVVVKGSAQGVAVPVVKALLADAPAEASVWENVWVNPKHNPRRNLIAKRGEPPPIPRIDYTRIVPMQYGAPHAAVPVLMNLGCPFRCAFCTNTTIYPEMGWGNPQRVVAEMVEIMRVWKEIHPEGAAPPLEITMCDAALNAQPAQFDELCRALIDADWPLEPASIVTQIIVDGRMTPERVRLAMGAKLHHSFFGLESANPRIRKAMKKPGKKAEVAKALQTCADEGFLNGLNCGIIVGWPDETEEEFLETIEFLDWMVSIGVMRALSLIPMYRTPGMMDGTLLAGAEGEAKGLAWRLPTAAGSPAVRGRRYFHVFEHFAGLTVVQSPVPHRVVASAMLDNTPKGFWEQWIARRGEHPVDNRGDAKEVPSAPTSRRSSPEPDVSHAARTLKSEDATANPHRSERTLVGRGAAVVLRLNSDAGAGAFARVHAHGLSYVGAELPMPLRDVVFELGRAVAGLPEHVAPAERIWADVARIVESIAADVRLD